jgi:hypothetical protein
MSPAVYMSTHKTWFLAMVILSGAAAACSSEGGDTGGGGSGGVGPGQFACGSDAACDLATEFCYTDPGDGAQGASSHCVARPADCNTCDCLPHDGCTDAPCTGDATSGLSLSCYGGA